MLDDEQLGPSSQNPRDEHAGAGHISQGSGTGTPPEGEDEAASSTFVWEFGAEGTSQDRYPWGAQRIYGAQRPRDAARDTASGAPEAAAYDSTASRSGAQSYASSGPSRASSAPHDLRLHVVQRRLDAALDRWWIAGDLPDLALLRDGLRVLSQPPPATGLPLLTEAQQTLLLRAALYHRRGMITALRYHGDDERIALVLSEAMIGAESPFAPQELVDLLQRLDDAGETARMRSWLTGLERELARAVVNERGHRKLNARRALEALRDYSPTVAASGYGGETKTTTRSVARDTGKHHTRGIRQLILLALLLALVGLIVWQRVQWTPPDMIHLPPATYSLPAAQTVSAFESGEGPLVETTSEQLERVQLDGFLIDRYEVTNADYRRCVEAGACRSPRMQSSRLRRNYFVDRAFDAFPVVRVVWQDAQEYCAWRNRRLPTAAEWQVAASYAPATQRFYTYPWGEDFAVQRANSGASGIGDTVAVGTYRPGGDSPTGAVDMAGNVAEWTASPAQEADSEAGGAAGPAMIVKGGSFESSKYGLMAQAQDTAPARQSRDWLGFRCAKTHLPGLE